MGASIIFGVLLCVSKFLQVIITKDVNGRTTIHILSMVNIFTPYEFYNEYLTSFYFKNSKYKKIKNNLIEGQLMQLNRMFGNFTIFTWILDFQSKIYKLGFSLAFVFF